VFSDFPNQTAGWQDAVERAAALVENAKSRKRLAVQRIDPTGMVAELRSIYERAKVDYAAHRRRRVERDRRFHL
jgi:hypothetical protein